MPQLQVQRFIQADPARVFAAFADLANAPGRISGITHLEVLTPGPIGVGTRFRETRKIMGSTATEEMTITAFDPPRGYSVGCTSHGCEYHTVFRFIPDGEGTRVEMDFGFRAISLVAKVMGVFSVLMMGSLRRCLEDDLRDMKAYLEGERSTAAIPSRG